MRSVCLASPGRESVALIDLHHRPSGPCPQNDGSGEVGEQGLASFGEVQTICRSDTNQIAIFVGERLDEFTVGAGKQTPVDGADHV